MPKTSTASAARNLTSTTVGKGEAASKRKGRQAAAKVQANADRVAAMNADRDGMTRTACVQYLQTHGIYSGHSRDGIEQLRAEVARHKALVPAAERTLPTPTTTAPKVTYERLTAARAAAVAGPRGKGTAMADDELTAWIVAEMAAAPALTRHQAQQINWWVDGYAVGIHRFNTAWDQLVSSEAVA